MTAHGVESSPGIKARPAGRDEMRSLRIPIAALVAVLLVAPFVIYPVFLMKMLCFALFACAFNLLIGYVGLLSFGHALFFGGAGYLAAHAARVWGLPFELSVLTGMATGALLGLAVGGLAIRRQGIYFAMITLALAQMFFFYCLRARFTGGEDGIQGVPRESSSASSRWKTTGRCTSSSRRSSSSASSSSSGSSIRRSGRY